MNDTQTLAHFAIAANEVRCDLSPAELAMTWPNRFKALRGTHKQENMLKSIIAEATKVDDREWMYAFQYMLDSGDASDVEVLLKEQDLQDRYDEYAYLRDDAVDYDVWKDRNDG